MENKTKIGTLVILGGIALLGYFYFKKNKPTVAESQSEDLKKLSDYYGSGTGAQEDTKINVTYELAPESNKFGGVLGVSSPFLSLDFTRDLIQSKNNQPVSSNQFTALDLELQNLGTPNFKLSEQAIKELQNMNTGLGLDFSNLKF